MASSNGMPNPAPTTTGPHRTDIANRLDPTVDSGTGGMQFVGSGVHPATGHSHSTTTTTSATAGHGPGAMGASHGSAPEGTHGPHSSRVANALDPRVDSDVDGRARAGHTTGTHTGPSTGGVHTGTHMGPSTGGVLAGHPGTTAGYTSNVPEGTHGPHSSRLANTVDPRVDSDRDGRAQHPHHTNVGHTGTTGAGLGSTTATHAGTSTTGTHPPHASNIANVLDPRVDSDRRKSGADYTTAGVMSQTGRAPEGSHGPHGSRVGNAADPRIDSDRDGRAAHTSGPATKGPFTAGGPMSGHEGLSGTQQPHVGHTSVNHGSAPEGSHGPHNSRIANAVDPRVDSDVDGRARATHQTGPVGGTHAGHTGAHTGAYTTHSGAGATGSLPEGTRGPHASRVGNAADPRIDSDADGRAQHGALGNTSHVAATAGMGPAPHTSGPHKHDILNKLDPRVDSKAGQPGHV